MLIRRLRVLLIPFILLLAAALPACESGDPATAPATAPAPQPSMTVPPTPTPSPSPSLEGVIGIVDPANMGWPRQVEGLNGIITIPAKPQRIITASIGHDEMTLALVPSERLVAVGAVSKDETYSSVSALVQDKPEITRDPETIIAQAPDVVVTSPFFTAEGIEALTRVGIPVVQTELQHDPEARINSILFMGYIFGEEQRAFEFAAGGPRAIRRARIGDRRSNPETASARRHALLGHAVGRGRQLHGGWRDRCRRRHQRRRGCRH